MLHRQVYPKGRNNNSSLIAVSTGEYEAHYQPLSESSVELLQTPTQQISWELWSSVPPVPLSDAIAFYREGSQSGCSSLFSSMSL